MFAAKDSTLKLFFRTVDFILILVTFFMEVASYPQIEKFGFIPFEKEWLCRETGYSV